MPDSRCTPWIRRLHRLIFVLVACVLALIYRRLVPARPPDRVFARNIL